MNYQIAAAKAIKKFDWARKCDFVNLPKESQFRKLTVYESTGKTNGTKLSYVLFACEYCDKNGENYREVYIRVRHSQEFGIYAEIDLSSIHEI